MRFFFYLQFKIFEKKHFQELHVKNTCPFCNFRLKLVFIFYKKYFNNLNRTNF